jgi:hypothetical protein
MDRQSFHIVTVAPAILAVQLIGSSTLRAIGELGRQERVLKANRIRIRANRYMNQSERLSSLAG